MVASLAVLALAAYFFGLAGIGLRQFFTHDDLANLGRVQGDSIATVLRWNLLYFSPSYRPLGALFYRVFYEWFSLNPVPSRVFCFAMLAADLWIGYAVARNLTGSREAGALTVLLASYHVYFTPLYYNTGLCYDILCFFFYWAAFLYYIRIREQRDWPRWWQMAAISLLYIAALDAKEMAVTLPLIVILWELLFHPLWLEWSGIAKPGRRLATGALLAILTIPYVAGKLSGASIFASQAAYQPTVTAANYWRECAHLLDETLYLIDTIRPLQAVFVCVSLGAIAWLSRSAVLRFSWLVVMAGILPIAFIQPRGIVQAWVPALGFAIASANVAVRVRERIFRRSPSSAVIGSQIALFAVLTILLVQIHLRHGARLMDTTEEDVTRSVVNQLREHHPPLPKGGKVLVVSDPFPDPFTLASSILICLYYHDPDLHVTRLNRGDPVPDPARQREYEWVVAFR